METKTLAAGLTMLILATSTLKARAEFMFFEDRACWEQAVSGEYRDVDISGAENEQIERFTLPFPWWHPMAELDNPVARKKVPDSWATWSGNNKPYVLATVGNRSSLTLTFSGFTPSSETGAIGPFPRGLGAFGFEMQPNQLDVFGMYVELTTAEMDGRPARLIVTDYMGVNGNGGARFFGWSNGDPISSIRVVCDGCGFAIGRMVQAVPEPATLPLLGVGLLGVMHRRRSAHSASDTRVD